MATDPATEWEDDSTPPEPAPTVPPGWAPPEPLATKPVADVSSDVVALRTTEEQELHKGQHSKARRLLVTTAVFAGLFFLGIATSDASSAEFLLLVLIPLYLLTLPFVLRTPKRLRRAKPPLAERLDWQAKLMTSVVVFILIYLPFLFFTDKIIPYAALVEYSLFAFLLTLLLRLSGRSVGVASSLDALPPPTHRLHQQVVAPIDDAHYQRTLWLNYSFVEKGRGGQALGKRLDEILEGNGVEATRRAELLAPLSEFPEHGFRFSRRGREKRSKDRDVRAQALDQVYAQLTRELEQYA